MAIQSFAHAFGQRYELPIPLAFFILGGALVVFLSFLLVSRQKVVAPPAATQPLGQTRWSPFSWLPASISFMLLAAMIAAGIFGGQTLAENILPTIFWLGVWIIVPLLCGLIGNWTQPLNPFAQIAKLTASSNLRRLVLSRQEPLNWPVWLGWWPAVLLFFVIACGELIFNQIATLPVVTGSALIIYFIVSALNGLLFGESWLKYGEVFNVLFDTWGRLGYFRFGQKGDVGFAGGLRATFEAAPSRIIFVLLLLVSVSFDGLLATPAWNNLQHQLPASVGVGTLAFQLLITLLFIALAIAMWALFTAFAFGTTKATGRKTKASVTLAKLLASLLPISFGYLLAHNLQYVITNGQLIFPLLGNPVGKEWWPFHLPYPFNDSFEVNIHLLPSSTFWYVAIVVVIAVHVAAVVIAHKSLASISEDRQKVRQAEYPWLVAMIGYTMLSLWLLAQPLVQEKPQDVGINSSQASTKQT
jgi:hypothetical protein